MTTDLLEAATAAMAKAHVPYSHFPVGAAIRSASGSVHVGCNVENAAYPEGVCAETSAISAMVMAGERTIDTILVVSASEMLSTCCGGCRQRIREFATPATRIVVTTTGGLRREYSIDELLPDSFGPENLRGT
jgi:cytidine deaminase